MACADADVLLKSCVKPVIRVCFDPTFELRTQIKVQRVTASIFVLAGPVQILK